MACDGGGGGVRGRGALVLMQLRGKCHLKSGSFGGRDGLSHWEVGILTVKNEVLGKWVTLKIIGGHLKFFVRLFIIPPPPPKIKRKKSTRTTQKKMNGPLIYHSVQG